MPCPNLCVLHCCLLRYNPFKLGIQVPSFQRNVLSGSTVMFLSRVSTLNNAALCTELLGNLVSIKCSSMSRYPQFESINFRLSVIRKYWAHIAAGVIRAYNLLTCVGLVSWETLARYLAHSKYVEKDTPSPCVIQRIVVFFKVWPPQIACHYRPLSTAQCLKHLLKMFYKHKTLNYALVSA